MKQYLILFLILFAAKSYGQNNSNGSFINMTVPIFNKQDSIEYLSIVNLFDKYLKSKDVWSADNPYWSYQENKLQGYYQGRYIHNINHSFKYGQNYYKPTILAITKLPNNAFTLKIAFMHAEPTGFCRLSSIINLMAIKEDGIYRLKSMQDHNLKQDYQKQNENFVTLYRKKNRLPSFPNLLQKYDSINIALAARFNSDPLKPICYILEDTKEKHELWGFDFDYDIANNSKGEGLSYLESSEIYITGSNIELFTHELVHLYTYSKFANCVHPFFQEGVSSFLGQCAYKNLPLEKHLFNITRMLKNDTKYSFQDLLNLKHYDYYTTHISYAIGALFCKIMYEKEGMNGIFKLLCSGTEEQDLYNTIENVIGIKRENIDTFIKQELKKYE